MQWYQTAARPDQPVWLARRILQVVETICQPFLRGEHMLFTVRSPFICAAIDAPPDL
jgi:hypothetical protein